MVKLHYPEMKTLEDLVYYTQLNQADALKFGIEHYRRLKGRCWGTLFWQINDCWPVQSWAVIDSQLQHKAAFYASRSFYAPILLSLKRDEEQVEVHVVNDRLGPLVGTATVALKTFDGDVLAEETFRVGVHCNEKDMFGTLSLTAAAGRENKAYVVGALTSPEGELLARNLILLDEPKDLALSKPELAIDFEEHDEETLAVIIGTNTFTGSIWLYVDPEEAPNPPEFSDNFFHLEAGETRTILVPKTDDILTGEDLRELLRVRTLFGEE
jgi:beta-mannosidase